MDKLPIENNQRLLTEYGRFFAWLNRAEALLEELIKLKGGLYGYGVKKELISSIFENKGFGYKINIARCLLDEDLFESLKRLNTERNKIIHGFFNFDYKLQDNENFPVIHKNKSYNINEDYVKNIIEQAKNVNLNLEKLFMTAIKEMSKEIKIEREIIEDAKKGIANNLENYKKER